MVEVLRIADVKAVVLPNGRESRFLALDLRDLLLLVADEGPRLSWAALSMGEGTDISWNGGPRSDEVLPLCDRVDAADEPVSLDWHDLLDLSASFNQTIWGTFLAARDPAALAETPSMFLDQWCYVDRASVRFYETVDLAFQAVDGSYWLVWARDEAVRGRIRGAFSKVEIIPGMSRYEPSAKA